jgi:hypothetical protein
LKYILYILLGLLFLLGGCKEEKKRDEVMHPRQDSVVTAPEPEIDPEPSIVNFYKHPINKSGAFKALIEEFGETEAKIILYVNRIDSKYLRRLDTLVVPENLKEDIIFYAPFPRILKKAEDVRKLLVFSRRIQAFAAYEYGKLVNWGPTSTGKRSTPTPAGLYFTNWKAKSTISTVNSEWILPWAFNLDNRQGISIHQYEMPGYPASHACARLLEEDAKWIYYWAEQWILTRDERSILGYGTPVIIFGDYDFKETAPWKLLPEDNITALITTEEINPVIDEYIEEILEKQEAREELIAAREAESEEEKN